MEIPQKFDPRLSLFGQLGNTSKEGANEEKKGQKKEFEGQFGNCGPDKKVEWFLSNTIMNIWRFTCISEVEERGMKIITIYQKV